MNLYIYSYNNYYNRIVKKETSLKDYEPYLVYGPVTGVYGFTQGDGVNTNQLIGSNAQMYSGEGDYLIAHDPQTNKIDSRWFIIDCNRTRDGQWQLTLHRDLVVDYYDEVIDAPCFIEKATLRQDDKLIFNNEEMSFNQIKTKETLLKDKSEIPWIVGYYEKDLKDFSGTVSYFIPENTVSIGSNIEDWKYFNNTNLTQNYQDLYGKEIGGNYEFYLKYPAIINTIVYVKGVIKMPFNFNSNAYWEDYQSASRNPSYQCSDTRTNIYGIVDAINTESSSAILGLNSQIKDYLPYDQTIATLVENYNGKVINANGRYFTCSINIIGNKERSKNIPLNTKLANDLENIIPKNLLTGSANNDTYAITSINPVYKITLEEIFDLEVSYHFDPTKVQQTLDAPYHVFAIPYGKMIVRDYLNPNQNTGLPYTDVTVTKEIGMAIASSIIANTTGGQLYDIQLLPYCPVPGLVTAQESINLYDEKDAVILKQQNDIKAYIFNVPFSQFTTIISHNENKAETSITKKINSECDKWRITDPTYSNYFDFSVEKNDGLDSFLVSCAYKPYSPYIQLKPNFKGLYGDAFNDVRGLICGGDYSLSQIDDQWRAYQINNKNYQNTFDRQIQNMEVQNKVGRLQDTVGALTGSLSGGTSGALAGSMLGGPWGAAAGAVVGTAASIAGGLADYRLNEMLRNEALDYTKDLFGYQLGNIQALPNTLTKVSAFNPNNRIFPVLEYYTCTDREKNAFAEKLAWNGMTVMAIGKINDYLGQSWSYNGIESQGYIKGKLINLPDLDINYNVLNSLAGEINKGVFIK